MTHHSVRFLVRSLYGQQHHEHEKGSDGAGKRQDRVYAIVE
jgi:hypothetical protein